MAAKRKKKSPAKKRPARPVVHKTVYEVRPEPDRWQWAWQSLADRIGRVEAAMTTTQTLVARIYQLEQMIPSIARKRRGG